MKDWNDKDPQLPKQLQKVWDLSARYEVSYEPDTEEGLRRFRRRRKAEKEAPMVAEKRSSVVSLTIRRLIAVAAVVAGLFLLLPVLTPSDLPVYQTTTAEVKEVELPDGSVIVLNEKSELRLDRSFVKGKTRKVQLTGEAHFDIQPDQANPFVIETRETSIKVLGTAFTLRAYPDEDSTLVAVNEGKVLFADKKEELLLEANWRGLCDHTTKNMEKSEDQHIGLPQWYLSRPKSFRDCALRQFLDHLEVRYNVRFNTPASLTSNCPISFSIKRNEKLSSVLQRLEVSFNGEIEKKKGKNIYQIKEINCN